MRFPLLPRITLTAALSLTGSALLSGCTMSSFPASSLTGETTTTTLGHIQGNVYGGHAPLVGAHIFVLEGYTSASGYGQPAKSLLSASYAGSIPTQLEPAGTAVSGLYYGPTDQNGYFNITGSYACDPGYPVYLYAEGGNPQAPTASQTTTTVTGATITGTGPYIITFTVPAPSLLYQGEGVTFTGSGGTFATYLNGSVQNVLANTSLTTTSFSVSVGSLTNNGVTVTTGTQSTAALGTLTLRQTSAPSNPATVNLAVLGLCPSTGNANFTYLNFVYMNEVSTAATAYALGGFFPAPGSAGLAVAGAVAANLSIPQNDALALRGLQNAALTAGQLYDIQGSNSACTGTNCNGDTHIARPTTPGLLTGGNTTAGSATVTGVPTTAGLAVGMTITGATLGTGKTISAIGTNTLTLSSGTGVTAGSGTPMYAGAGAGTVPQALINTVGNILANCVDSANTSVTASTQCSTLFANAKSAGTTGTLPIDTASAAINIAHNPWANVTTLVNLPTGNVPFQPVLSSANDLSAAIQYTPTQVSNPEGIAIDAQGRVWYPNYGSGYVTVLNPFGGVQYNVNVGGHPDYIAIDGTGQAWVSNQGINGMQRINSTGSLIGTYGTPNITLDSGVAVDGTNDTGYIYAGTQALQAGVVKFDGSGNQIGTLPATQNCNPINTQVSHLAADNQNNGYNLWVVYELGQTICKMNSISGAALVQLPITGSGIPEFPAIDATGTAWIPLQLGQAMTKVTQAGTLTNPTGGSLNNPFGAAVDGAGNIFVTNRGGNDVTEYLGSTSAAVSTVNLRGGSTTTMSDPLNVMVDPSGFLWISNFYGSRITQILGVAAPTWQPLSDAGYNNKLGSRP